MSKFDWFEIVLKLFVISIIATLTLFSLMDNLNNRGVLSISNMNLNTSNPKIFDNRALMDKINELFESIKPNFNIKILDDELPIGNYEWTTKIDYLVSIDDLCRKDGPGMISGNKCCVDEFCSTQTSQFEQLNGCDDNDFLEVMCSGARRLSGVGLPAGYFDGTDDCAAGSCCEYLTSNIIVNDSVIFNLTDFKLNCKSRYLYSVTLNCPIFPHGALVPKGTIMKIDLRPNTDFQKVITINQYRLIKTLNCVPNDRILTCLEGGRTIGTVEFVGETNWNLDDSLRSRIIKQADPKLVLQQVHTSSSISMEGFEIVIEERSLISLIIASSGFLGIIGFMYTIVELMRKHIERFIYERDKGAGSIDDNYIELDDT
jgi:hypothetical protein